MAVAEKTLLEFLLSLLHDDEALADFRENPEAALEHAGLGDCSVEDLKAIMPIILEKVDAEKCAQYEDDVDDDDCWDSVPKHHNEDHCKPIDCDDEGRPAAHCSQAEQVVAHLNYVTNNYNFVDNSHDTYNITNNDTDIWADHGANVEVDNETHNVGPNAVSIEGDSNAPFATGGHNVVGDGNQVSGEGSTTAFGTGSALSHVGTGDGGAISVNGPASGNDADTDFENHGGTAALGGNASDSHASTITDSGNETHTTTHTEDNSETDNSLHYQDHADNSSSSDSSVNDSNNSALEFHP